MKNWIYTFLCLVGFCPVALTAQSDILSDAWSDPGFLARFTDSYLPLTDQEPSITEKESTLLKELATLLEAGNMAMGIEAMEAAVIKVPNPEAVNAALNYTLGNLYIQNGRFEEAATQYRAAITKFKDFRRAYKNLALAEIQSASYEDAIETLVKTIEMGDSAGDTFGLLAYCYLNEGNSVAALEGYRQAALLNPSNPEWRIGKAEALMRTNRYLEAISQFKQLITEMPNRNAFYTSIANAYLSIEDNQSAARYLEIHRRRGEANASALGLLGDIYLNDGLAKLAADAYMDALDTGSFSTTRSLRAMKAFLGRGYYEEGEMFLEAIIAKKKDALSEEENREVLNFKAQVALAKGANEDAADILEQVIESDPFNGNALLLLGGFHQEEGDLENAIYYFQRAVSIPDTQRDAQLQLARVYVQQREYLLAIRQLEAAVNLEYSANVQDFLDAVRAVHNRSM